MRRYQQGLTITIALNLISTVHRLVELRMLVGQNLNTDLRVQDDQILLCNAFCSVAYHLIPIAL